ncbi:MAG: substrate-binding domain-containing protein [Candidatus Contendobacter sp.]|nr:substrate-binding domain-containing protein [Candidatus Contendobacter sp.]MDG4556320.1 substrate-binding domain-containing protein [Candidatus Contendobacter sp.]
MWPRIVFAWLTALTLMGAAFAEELSIPGSGNPEYVLTQLAKAFNRQQSQHTVTIPSSIGTAGALRDIEAGTASLGRVGRPLKDDERGKGIVYVALGRDPVAFVAGAGVTVRGITSARAVDVFSGKLTDWSELGGGPAPIRAVGRETTDASRQAISRVIKPFETIVFGGNIKVVHLDPELVALLDRFPTSLGFLNRSALGACATQVIPLALDGVEPTLENLEKGSYPLWLEPGLIHKPDALTPAGKAFLAFVRSPAGARILREHGILPHAAGSR